MNSNNIGKINGENSTNRNPEVENHVVSPNQIPLFPPDTDSNEVSESAEDQDATSSHFSLPVVMFTHEFLKMCIDNKLGRITMLLALSMLGNMDKARGFIHKFKVQDKAKFFGCSEARIYQSLHILRDLKFANLKLRNGTVSGRIAIKSMLPGYVLAQYEKFKARKALESADLAEDFDTGGHAMPVGMLHHLQLETHISGGTTAAHLCLIMACCLNVDVQTGKLKEKRPVEWAELSGMNRTWVVEGFDRLNELGIIQTKTDYDVMGRLPFVALANGVFHLLEFKRQERREDSEDRFIEKCTALYEAFGIQLKGLAHDIIENAWRLLGADADRILRDSKQKMKKLLGREPSGSFERRRIVQGAEKDRIPDGKTLHVGELIGQLT